MASKTGPIKVMHVGLGPIGAAVVRQVASRKGFRVVGGIDIDPAKAGRDLGEVAGVHVLLEELGGHRRDILGLVGVRDG